MKKTLCLLVIFCFIVMAFAGCNKNSAGNTDETNSNVSQVLDENHKYLNGRPIAEYTIVYSASEPDYTKRAATYLSEQIKERTGVDITVKSDKEQINALEHEIVVGETNRPISKALDIETKNVQFSMLADDSHIAMEGDYFVIAAAAYYFVDTYIKDGPFDSNVEKKEMVYDPIVKKAKNYIFFIGDGMGVPQTKLFADYTAEQFGLHSDGEDEFYGYMFPYIGASRTDSLSGTTDSAAGGTALSSGFKTFNDRVGMDRSFNNVKSLTEIAIELNKSTAVLTTDLLTGATPATFSVHTKSRNNTDEILAGQADLKEKYGTIFLGGYEANYDKKFITDVLERDFTNTLAKLSENENGFFMMYEEAHFDKHGHYADIQNIFKAGVRFNQIIGLAMEYAFYNPETFIIMTADHETSGITSGKDGRYRCTTTNHTSADVPVFAYGYGADVFNGVTVENIQIPKTIAKLWDVELVGYEDELYPALGSEAAEEDEETPENDGADNENNDVIIWIIIGGLAVAIIAVLIAIVIVLKKNKKQVNQA